MTARLGTMSIDGTPISEADKARIEAEEHLHTRQQRDAVRVVAASSLDAEDCRTLLSILGLDTGDILAQARADLVRGHAAVASKRPAPKRARKSRAA